MVFDLGLESQTILEALQSKGWVHLQSESLETLAKGLLEKAISLESEGHFRQAKIGKGLDKTSNSEIRQDDICWMDPKELTPVDTIVENLRELFRKNLFLAIRSFECHFAKYEEGGFYLRHKDRHRKSSHRLITMVFYLSDLQECDGGELMLYFKNGETEAIRPKQGKLILFASETEHEVKPTKISRWSLTGWFRDDQISVIPIP